MNHKTSVLLRRSKKHIDDGSARVRAYRREKKQYKAMNWREKTERKALLRSIT